MGTGTKFGDVTKPKVMVKVGNSGDSGVLEIIEMLFTVKGPTAGAVLMEWNVHESSQGSGKVFQYSPKIEFDCIANRISAVPM